MLDFDVASGGGVWGGYHSYPRCGWSDMAPYCVLVLALARVPVALALALALAALALALALPHLHCCK